MRLKIFSLCPWDLLAPILGSITGPHYLGFAGTPRQFGMGRRDQVGSKWNVEGSELCVTLRDLFLLKLSKIFHY